MQSHFKFIQDRLLEPWLMEKEVREKGYTQKFGKFNRPSKQQKKSQGFEVVEIQPISREETDLRQQSTTIIVPNTQEVDGNDQSNQEEIIFCFTDRVRIAPDKQTVNNSSKSYKFI